MKTSNMGVILEPMNVLPKERETVLAVEYEWVPTLRSDFKTLNALWLDITGACGESEADVPKNQTAFEYTTSGIEVKTKGKIIAAGGHVHDGKPSSYRHEPC